MSSPKLFIAVATFLLGGLLAAGCGSDDAPNGTSDPATPAAERGIPVVVALAQTSSFEELIQMTGTVEAPDDATLSAEASGTIRTLAPLGTLVRAGQVVAQIDPTLARANVDQAEAALQSAAAQLELAEDQFTRQEPLYRDSIISALEFQTVRTQRANAQAQVAQARAVLAQAREQLSRTRVVAPFTGIVEEHVASRGSQVTPGQAVARVVASGILTVRAGVPERYSGDVGVGTSVLVTPQAYDLPPQRGEVVFAGQSIDPQSRTFPIELRLDNRDGRLKPQMVVRLEVTRRKLQDVIVVPMSSVVRDERGTSIFVVRQEDVPRARILAVSLGASSSGRVVVVDGLEAGDMIITEGQTTVADGDAVHIASGPSPSALSSLSTPR